MRKLICYISIIHFLGCSTDSLPTASSPDPVLPTEKTTFLESLPENVQSKIIWFSDFEDNSFEKWEDEGTSHEFSGGGIFNTDEPNIDYGIESDIVHSGERSSFAKIENAITPGEPKAIRFMRWTDKAWNENGQYFPNEVYYSVFVYFPKDFDPAKPQDNDALGDGGWWNIFQFKSDNNAGSQPIAVLDLYNSENKMHLGLVIKDYPNDDSDEHTQEYIEQQDPLAIPSGKWVHLEAFYKKSADYSGKIMIWQDGQPILERNNFRSIFFEDGTAVWGIGNYTDYINGGQGEGNATVYFDDVLVSSVRIGEYLK